MFIYTTLGKPDKITDAKRKKAESVIDGNPRLPFERLPPERMLH